MKLYEGIEADRYFMPLTIEEVIKIWKEVLEAQATALRALTPEDE